MTQQPHPADKFDVWNSAFMAKLPLMRLQLETHANDIRAEVTRLAKLNGPFQLKLQHHRDNRFSDVMFNWVVVSRSPQETDDYEEIEDMIFWTPEYTRGEMSPALKAELDAAIGPHRDVEHVGVNTSMGMWFTTDSYHDIADLLRDYMRYRFHLAILDNSEPVEELRQIGADWLYEPRLDNPLLVVPDTKIGLMLKLKY